MYLALLSVRVISLGIVYHVFFLISNVICMYLSYFLYRNTYVYFRCEGDSYR